MKEKEKKWILEHLKMCGYQLQEKEILHLGREEIEKVVTNIYLVKIILLGEMVERIVWKHGDCLDMVSRNIQVKDMLRNEDIVFPRKDGKEIRMSNKSPIMQNDEITPESVIFYEDFVLLREHFFEANKFVQVACWVITDDPKTCLQFEPYGNYTLTVLTQLDEAV